VLSLPVTSREFTWGKGLTARRANTIARVATEVILLIENGMVAGRIPFGGPFRAEVSSFLHLHGANSNADDAQRPNLGQFN
jgi:hypothetical protein